MKHGFILLKRMKIKNYVLFIILKNTLFKFLKIKNEQWNTYKTDLSVYQEFSKKYSKQPREKFWFSAKSEKIASFLGK